jgi:hypothetical protein
VYRPTAPRLLKNFEKTTVTHISVDTPKETIIS